MRRFLYKWWKRNDVLVGAYALMFFMLWVMSW